MDNQINGGWWFNKKQIKNNIDDSIKLINKIENKFRDVSVLLINIRRNQINSQNIINQLRFKSKTKEVKDYSEEEQKDDNLLDAILATIRDTVSSIVLLMGPTIGAMTSILDNIMKGLHDHIDGLAQGLSLIVGTAIDSFGAITSSIVDGIATVVGFVPGLGPISNEMHNWAKNIVNATNSIKQSTLASINSFAASTKSWSAPHVNRVVHDTIPNDPTVPSENRYETVTQISNGKPAENEAILKTAAINAGITDKTELDQFMAQSREETGNFKRFNENLNYTDTGLVKTFHKYFPTLESTIGYAHNPERIANKVYANRMGNGSEASGDGYRYRGRGYIQLTGRNNYKIFGAKIGVDLENNPDMLNDLVISAKTTVAFWLKVVRPRVKDFSDTEHVTKLVNGGLINLATRQAYFADYTSKPVSAKPPQIKSTPAPQKEVLSKRPTNNSSSPSYPAGDTYSGHFGISSPSPSQTTSYTT